MPATPPVSNADYRPVPIPINDYVRADTVNVTNGSFTPVTCPLRAATFAQVYIQPSSTQQIYTVRLPNNEEIEVPSGQNFALRVPDYIGEGETMFDVQTATGAAVLQVVAFREELYPRALGVS